MEAYSSQKGYPKWYKIKSEEDFICCECGNKITSGEEHTEYLTRAVIVLHLHFCTDCFYAIRNAENNIYGIK